MRRGGGGEGGGGASRCGLNGKKRKGRGTSLEIRRKKLSSSLSGKKVKFESEKREGRRTA